MVCNAHIALKKQREVVWKYVELIKRQKRDFAIQMVKLKTHTEIAECRYEGEEVSEQHHNQQLLFEGQCQPWIEHSPR